VKKLVVVWFGFGGFFLKKIKCEKKNWWWFGLVLGGIF
jgi:hypothetical protein